MTVPSRQVLAELWYAAAQVTRQDIFGADDALRPQYEDSGDLAAQIDVPALGTVGRRYNSDSLTFVSVNPAGGKPQSRSSLVDSKLYEAFVRIRDAASPELRVAGFENVTDCFKNSVPTWTIWRQYVEPILRAVGRTFDETAYLYLVPFRTRGDAGSSMPDVFIRTGYKKHVKRLLDAISPRLIIAVDRPSERSCAEWATMENSVTEVFYYTRKRDAHAERKQLLSQLKERRGP